MKLSLQVASRHVISLSSDLTECRTALQFCHPRHTSVCFLRYPGKEFANTLSNIIYTSEFCLYCLENCLLLLMLIPPLFPGDHGKQLVITQNRNNFWIGVTTSSSVKKFNQLSYKTNNLSQLFDKNLFLTYFLVKNCLYHTQY